ncbi:Thioredoxin-1 [Acinetobacter calcoaceticus]|uniref:Thioredoxin-1 n=1 Tax=Acinetobacter calcoaceticus TaxID=471 RepID=A0A446ZIQ9_ACICA|nr:thioredoxin family protein [Acinetobacter calcoaceticus]VAX44346.1 Thioredoxin-1 [Acinetobacter calcoaceticus]
MRKLHALNEDSFHEIEWKEGLAMVRFYAPWCPPCHNSESLFNTFVKSIEANLTIGTVNVDQAPVLTTRYNIWGLPSVLMFKDGQLIHHIVGVKPISDYQKALEELIKYESKNDEQNEEKSSIGSLCLTKSEIKAE